MELREMIQIRGEPFPKPLPRPISDLLALFKAHGYLFVDEGGVLRLREKYDPKRFDDVKQLLSRHELSVDLWRSICPVFDDQDYDAAPLWLTLFPEIWIDGIDFTVKCDVCGAKHVQVNLETRVQQVDSNKSILTVNGQFTIVRSDLGSAIEKGLSGAVLSPFDREGKYFYLLSKQHLRTLIMTCDNVLGFRGTCPKCSSPQFEMLIGPLLYESKEWNRDDVVYCDFHSCNVYTPRAFKLIRNFEKKAVRDGIVLLKDLST